MSITLFLIYSFSKQKMFEISFAGGCIAFKASNYSEEEIDKFQKNLRMVKDSFVNQMHEGFVNSSSTADELTKYKMLLDSGAISYEEYEKAKKQILN